MAKVGYTRKAPGYPLAEQIEALEAFGCTKIYEAHERDSALSHGLRGKNDRLVLFSLHLLGTSRADLQDALEQAALKKVQVTDLSHPDLVASAAHAAWITDALRKVTGERRRPSKKAAARGGAKRKGWRKPREKSRTDLHAIWFDKSILTNDEAAERAGVPKRSLYRLFGASGRPAGWPGKRDTE